MDSALDDAALPAPGFPIRRSAGQRLFSASPRLIAAVHVLLRLLVPRHPPCALSILTVSARAEARACFFLTRFGLTCSFQAPPRPPAEVFRRSGLWKLSSARAPARPPGPCPGDGAGQVKPGRH